MLYIKEGDIIYYYIELVVDSQPLYIYYFKIVNDKSDWLFFIISIYF